jgi:hypothetical protein
MNIADFFLEWNGKICNTGSYPGQCVNIIKQYYVEVFNRPAIAGNAIDYQYQTGFIKKTIFSKPLPGDIVIFNYGKLGHIGICNWTTFFSFNCFEQNNPVGSPCHFVTHYTYASVLGWVHYEPVVLPKNPLVVACVGLNLPLGEAFLGQVAKYASGKIICILNDYLIPVNVTSGMLDQDHAYEIVDIVKPKEKFIFIFYPSNSTSSFYATFYDPMNDCMITTCPGTDARSLAFEFSHQLQEFFNEHRGSNLPVQVVDSNYPSDDLIFSKYNSVSKFYL